MPKLSLEITILKIREEAVLVKISMIMSYFRCSQWRLCVSEMVYYYRCLKFLFLRLPCYIILVVTTPTSVQILILDLLLHFSLLILMLWKYIFSTIQFLIPKTNTFMPFSNIMKGKR